MKHLEQLVKDKDIYVFVMCMLIFPVFYFSLSKWSLSNLKAEIVLSILLASSFLRRLSHDASTYILVDRTYLHFWEAKKLSLLAE